MFLKATFALTAMIWTYTMLDNVLVGKFFNKKYDMNLLHKKDKMLGQSKKLGKVEKGVMKNDETGSFKQYLIEILGDFG